MLDDLWGILLAKERELTSPLISEHQYEALLHGLAEVVALGREKMAGGPKLKATSRLNLQFLLQNHKVQDFCSNPAREQRSFRPEMANGFSSHL